MSSLQNRAPEERSDARKKGQSVVDERVSTHQQTPIILMQVQGRRSRPLHSYAHLIPFRLHSRHLHDLQRLLDADHNDSTMGSHDDVGTSSLTCG